MTALSSPCAAPPARSPCSVAAPHAGAAAPPPPAAGRRAAALGAGRHGRRSTPAR